MARTVKLQTAAAPAPAAPDNDLDVESTPGGELDDLGVMMASLAGSSTANVTVYRVVKGQPLAYVFACTPDAFSLDELRDKYNGGEFRLYISKDGTLWKNKRVFVEPKLSGQNVEPPSAVQELAAAMREGFAKQSEALRHVAAASAAPAAGGLPSLASLDIPAIISAIAAAVTAFRPAPVPPAPAVDPSKSIDMFIQGLEIGRELRQDGGKDEPTLLGMLNNVIQSPMMAQAVASTLRPQPARRAPPPHQQIPQRVPIQQAPTPQAPPQPSASFASETVQPMNTPSELPVAQYLSLLCAKAQSGADPALYADLILDNIDDDTLAAVLNGQPTPVDFLADFHPPVRENRDWFDSLIATMREALDADSNNEAQSGGLATPSAPNASDPTASDVPG